MGGVTAGSWTRGAGPECGEKAKKVAYLSDDYFALLKAHPEASSWFALGPKVVVRVEDGSVVEVTQS